MDDREQVFTTYCNTQKHDSGLNQTKQPAKQTQLGNPAPQFSSVARLNKARTTKDCLQLAEVTPLPNTPCTAC